MSIFNSKLPKVETSIFTVMSQLANECNAINLSQGFPNFKIDEQLKNYVKEGLDKEQVQYAPMIGRKDLRDAISNKILEQHQVKVNADTEITITAGATQAIFTIFSAMLHQGDEVILFDPAYDCYDPSIRLQGAIPIHLELKHPNYNIDWNEVKQSITDKTKMIVINNPKNPTGAILNSKDLDELELIIKDNPQLYILSDEVYEHIQFVGEHQSVLKRKLLRNKSFVTYSFGKTFHVTGLKLGYCVAPPVLTDEFRKVHQFNVFCVNNTMQYGIANYMNETTSWRDVMPFYKHKRELFLKAMEGSKLKPLACNGTYFCLFDYSDLSDENDVDFAKRITKEYGVATIPVSVFYQNKTDHKVVRICFAKTEDKLLQAAELLKKIN
ncbi:MAG TPA: aminotransferase class I/II-fold pyridoxal phosphate-dependent enzyme, partial [Saprospiraceae bacterium]|nr:aminotransferase class I/II-fold pyridoxal phosphate-dependent enzyme [Saprospiraceae bacterium]